jgi:delta24-sterol reductase
MFSKDCTVVCSGRLAERLPEGTKPQGFTRSTDPWFFVHVRRLQKRLRSSASAETTEFIPLVDYLFRYDRGGFWVAMYSFRYFLTPFNRITRFLLDPLMHSRTMYRALHQSGLADYYLVQDVGVPYDKVSEFVDWLHDTLHIYPLWLCPLRLARDTPDAHHGLHSQFADLEPRSDASWLMNFGIWGPGSSDRREFVRQNRLLELKVQALGGKKWLYAHAYYTEAEFWAHYGRKSYDDVRAKYGAAWMPSVYDKVKVDIGAEERELRRWTPWLLALFWSIWPLRGLYGVLMTLLGGDYLLKTANQAQILKED